MRRKTTEEFKKEVYNLVGDNYQVLGDYKKARIKIKMKHIKCGHIYPVRPYSFLQGVRCPRCFGNFRKSTNEFKKQVKKQVGEEYTVLGRYKNANTKIKMQHNKCGHIWMVTPDSFLNAKTRCPECFGSFKKTTEEFKQEIQDKFGDEYEVLGEYQSAHDMIWVRHICGHKYKVKPNNLLSEKGCPKCDLLKRREKYSKSIKLFKQQVRSQVGDEYSVIGNEYFNSKSKIEMRHNSCGHIWPTTPDVFLNGKSRCPKCFGNSKKTRAKYIAEIKELYGYEYTILGEYKNARKPLLSRHNVCGHEWEPLADNLLRGYGCPKCASSKIEKKFRLFLEDNNMKEGVNFNQNKAIKGCRYKKKLKFDFQILLNTEDYFLIEFDGEFHYYPIMSKKRLEVQQKRDKIKDEFCKKNGIQLLRIPFWEFDTIKGLIAKGDTDFLDALKRGQVNYFNKILIKQKPTNIGII